MIYATFSDGVKPGGTNLNPFSTQIPSVFKHETVDELEIGTKNQFFDRRLRVNIAAFYNDYRNMQVDSEDPLPYQGGVTNIGRLHTYGVEADVSALLPYSFRVDANLAAMDGKVDSHTHLIDPVAAQEANRLYGVFTPADLAARAAAEVDIHGRTPGKLPPFSASLAISRTDDMPFGGTLESRLQVLYRAAYYFRVYNIPAYDKVPDMHQLDLSFRYQPQNPHWYAELLVVNLTDSNSVNARIADNFGVGEVANLYVPPRQIIGRLGVRF
jgi:iron complex outermembrane receptor protein